MNIKIKNNNSSVYYKNKNEKFTRSIDRILIRYI